MNISAGMFGMLSTVLSPITGDGIYTDVLVCQDKFTAREIAERIQENDVIGQAYARAVLTTVIRDERPLCSVAVRATQKIGEGVLPIMDPDQVDNFFVIPVTYQISDETDAEQYDGFMLERMRTLRPPPGAKPSGTDL